MSVPYSDLPNLMVSAENGVDYLYRDTGGYEGQVPLVLLQHYRGTLDYWDPGLIDALAASRRVITFDNAGVSGSTGTTPDTFEAMGRDASAFIAALGLSEVDLLGFSIGSYVAQEIVLTRPTLVRRLILASSAPKGAAGMHGWAPDVIGAIDGPTVSAEQYLTTLFTPSEASQTAGMEVLGRIFTRTDREKETSKACRDAQYDAVLKWGIPVHAELERVSAINMPVFIANGDSDKMIFPHFSYILAGLIPQAKLKMYPDAGHAFLFQHYAEFAADVHKFLA